VTEALALAVGLAVGAALTLGWVRRASRATLPDLAPYTATVPPDIWDEDWWDGIGDEPPWPGEAGYGGEGPMVRAGGSWGLWGGGPDLGAPPERFDADTYTGPMSETVGGEGWRIELGKRDRVRRLLEG
jgi:hypothetical protein